MNAGITTHEITHSATVDTGRGQGSSDTSALHYFWLCVTPHSAGQLTSMRKTQEEDAIYSRLEFRGINS